MDKFSNALKIYFMKHPEYIGKPSLKELKKEGLLKKVDLDDEEIEKLYSSEELINIIEEEYTEKAEV